MVVSMQLDTRIPLMVQGPQIESPQNMLAQALKVRQLQGQVQEQDRAISQRNALAGVLGTAFDDNGRLNSGALGKIAQAAPDYAPQYANLAATQQRLDRQDQLTTTALAQKRFDWLRNAAAASSSPQDAYAQIENGVQMGVVTPQEAQTWKSQIPTEQGAFDGWIKGINNQMMTAGQRAQLSKGTWSAPVQTTGGFIQADREGNTRYLTDPTSGKPLMPINADADLAGRKKGAEADAKALSVAKENLPKVESGAATMLRVIDAIDSHPGKERAVGAYMGQVAPSLLGSNAVDFERKREQLQGQLFLQAYDQLRGGGQITEVEGAKAEAALANMSRAQSLEQFNSALGELRSVVVAARDRARKAAGGQSSAPNAPAPAQNTGGILSPAAAPTERQVVRSGTLPDGRRIVQYSDGSTGLAE